MTNTDRIERQALFTDLISQKLLNAVQTWLHETILEQFESELAHAGKSEARRTQVIQYWEDLADAALHLAHSIEGSVTQQMKKAARAKGVPPKHLYVYTSLLKSQADQYLSIPTEKLEV